MAEARGAAGAALPHVLVVDDDAAVRRLVQLALEDLPIALHLCDSVAAAQTVLHGQGPPPRLIVTDLMMPGVSGLDFLAQLVATPALRRGARLVAFSAGLDAAMRQRLQTLGVWRLLSKPVSLQALEDCVLEGVSDGATEGVRAGVPGDGVEAAEPRATPASASATADEAQAITTHFGGNAGLFTAFRESCLAQFAGDIATGEQALAAADLPALRRLGHSLKSVLSTLGLAEAAALARALDESAAAGDATAAQVAWLHLRTGLQALAGPGPVRPGT